MNLDNRKNASSTRSSEVGPARGVLKVNKAPRGQFHHSRLAAPAAISSLVQHIWIVRWKIEEGASHVAQTLPHPNVHLVFEGGQAIVSGVHRGRFTRELKGVGGAVGVKFRPGGFFPLLKKSVSTLRNRTVPLESVFGSAANDLQIEMSALGETEALTLIESFLLRHWPAIDPNVERIATLVAEIETDRSVLRVEDLVVRCGLTKRSLQRWFEQYVGIGPKWVINRFRMHEALEQLHRGQPLDWAQFALELGYFDQAHFNRDFKMLVGCTPKRYAVNA
jgi:AraC-like DNA-binding protein